LTNVFIFGDSFSAEVAGSLSQTPWANILKDQYHYTVINHALGGSSTEYSLHKLIETVGSGAIKDNDVVVFQTSTMGRLHFKYQLNKRPDTAWMYCRDIDSSAAEQHKWYVENQENIFWYLENLPEEWPKINHLGMVNFVKSWALSRPHVTVILLQLIDVHRITSTSPELRSMPPIESEKNFLVPPIDLYQLSINESGLTFWEFTEYLNWDIRQNHLTWTNRALLAENVKKCIDLKIVDHFTYDSFKKNIIKQITSYGDWLYYNQLGIIDGSAPDQKIWKK
jgi:hypothetical protein